jgi:hypothetical protein
MSAAKDRLRQLVDELPEDRADEAVALLEEMSRGDDGQVSPEEQGLLDEAEEAVRRGEVRPWAAVRRDLGV